MCRVLVMLVISARKEPPFQIQQTTSLGEYAQEGTIVPLEHMIHKNVLKEVFLIPLAIKISAAASRAHLASFVVQEDLNCHQGNVILDIFALVDRKQAHQLNIRVHLVIIVLWVVHTRCLAVMEPIRMNFSREHARSAFRAIIAMEQFSMLLTVVMECNSLLHVSRVTSVQVELNLLGNTSAQPEHLITGLMEKASTIALIVHLENTVKVKAMKYGQMIVPKDFIALAELTTLLLTMGSLESFVLLVTTAQQVQQLPYHV